MVIINLHVCFQESTVRIKRITWIFWQFLAQILKKKETFFAFGSQCAVLYGRTLFVISQILSTQQLHSHIYTITDSLDHIHNTNNNNTEPSNKYISISISTLISNPDISTNCNTIQISYECIITHALHPRPSIVKICIILTEWICYLSYQ